MASRRAPSWVECVLLPPVSGTTKPWSIVRFRPAVLALQFGVLTALVGGTTAFVTFDKTVTLSVDGNNHKVHSFARTVGDVLEHEGVKVGPHDIVAPTPSSSVHEGERITVRYGRLLTLTVDGKERKIWTTAQSVDAALAQLGLRADNAYLSVSRSRSIGRDGLALELRTPKKFTVLVDHKSHTFTSTQATVAAALQQVGVKVDKDDRVTPAPSGLLHAGEKVVVQRITVRKVVKTTPVAFSTVAKHTSSLYDGQRRVETAGKSGKRSTTYRETIVDGKLSKITKVTDRVTAKPVSAVVLVGTKDRPSSSSSRSSSSSSSSSRSSSSSSSTVHVGSSNGLNWGALAQCESGGNPSIVSSNGLYYGLYQFSVQTWRAVGGSGLPSQASAGEQTMRAQILYDRAGRGQWPVCGRYL